MHRNPSNQEVFTFREKNLQTHNIANVQNDVLSTVNSPPHSPTATLIKSAKEVSERSARKRTPQRLIRKDWNPFLQEIKSSLFDMVSDFRDRWESDASLKKEYDQLVKNMVLLSLSQASIGDEEEEPMMKVVDLIKQVVSVFRRNLEYQNGLQSKKGDQVKEM